MNAAERLLDDPRLATLFAALAKTGAETRVVGGAVRDALFGLPPHEIDLATTALPEAVMAAAQAAGLKGVPTGIEHGTVTIVVAGTPFEVTTLREDVQTDGRYAIVRFGGDFEQDARRRDFTVNALSLTPDGKLHDYTGGLKDLAERRIRFIGDAATRIREDYLRVLRFFRFNASHGEGGFDREGLHELILARDNLSRLSRERIRAEVVKLLPARRAPEIMRRDVAGRHHRGVARHGLSGAAGTARGFRGGAGRRKATPCFASPRSRVERRGHGSPARPAAPVERRTCAPCRRCADARSLHGRETPPPVSHLREMLFLAGSRAAADALALAFAESGASPDDPQWLEAASYLDETPAPVFPIKGADLIARGVAPGRQLGTVLKSLQAKWIRRRLPARSCGRAAIAGRCSAGKEIALSRELIPPLYGEGGPAERGRVGSGPITDIAAQTPPAVFDRRPPRGGEVWGSSESSGPNLARDRIPHLYGEGGPAKRVGWGPAPSRS